MDLPSGGENVVQTQVHGGMKEQFHSSGIEVRMTGRAVEGTTRQDKNSSVENANYKVSIPDRKEWEGSFGSKHGIIKFKDQGWCRSRLFQSTV